MAGYSLPKFFTLAWSERISQSDSEMGRLDYVLWGAEVKPRMGENSFLLKKKEAS